MHYLYTLWCRLIRVFTRCRVITARLCMFVCVCVHDQTVCSVPNLCMWPYACLCSVMLCYVVLCNRQRSTHCAMRQIHIYNGMHACNMSMCTQNFTGRQTGHRHKLVHRNIFRTCIIAHQRAHNTMTSIRERWRGVYYCTRARRMLIIRSSSMSFRNYCHPWCPPPPPPMHSWGATAISAITATHTLSEQINTS